MISILIPFSKNIILSMAIVFFYNLLGTQDIVIMKPIIFFRYQSLDFILIPYFMKSKRWRILWKEEKYAQNNWQKLKGF